MKLTAIGLLLICLCVTGMTQGAAEETADAPELYLTCVKSVVDVDETVVLIETLEPRKLADEKMRLQFWSRKASKVEDEDEGSQDADGEQEPVEVLAERSALHFSHGTPLPDESSFHASMINHISFSEPGEYHVKVEWTVHTDGDKIEIESNTLKVIVRKKEKKRDKDPQK